MLLLAAVALLALSCRKEGLLPWPPQGFYRQSEVPVRAVPYLGEDWMPISRAVSDITAIDNSALQASGFGVYAFYTGAETYSASTDSSAYSKFGLVLNNRKFEYSGSSWEHTGYPEFWPMASGDNLTLFAYAPWDTWNGIVSYDGKVPSVKYDDYVAQSLSVAELSKQRDLLWGTNTSGNPHMNVEKTDYDPEGTVDFHFRHATAKVKFSVSGTLPGESRSQTSTGSVSTSTGSAGATIDGETTSETASSYTTNLREKVSNGVYNYYVRETQTETESYIQTQYRTNTETVTGAVYSVQGQRYLIEEVSFKGFNQKGTLVLNNTTAYYPSWTGVSAFTGSDPEYVLNASNVLTDSLQYVSAATVQSAFETYLGIQERPVDLMSGYFLYAIPRESSAGDRIVVTIKYHRLNVDGTLRVNQGREIVQVRTRTVTRTRTRTRESERIRVEREGGSGGPGGGGSYNYPTDPSSYTFSADFGSWSSWDGWSNPSWGSWTDYSYGAYNITSETLTGATVNYNDDPSPELSGEIVTSLLGGRAYNINLVVAGDKMELDVVPQPWELEEFEFDYNASINDVIQSLTYDSAYIDWADNAGHVYINNRLGKFFFRLGAGKYSSWQASLVATGGSSPGAFGFCDENGNFLLEEDGVTKVSYIRGAVDPNATNFIYVKAVDTEATVTSSAILRIYYIDPAGNATVALNLVNQQNVTEWIIVQNAN